MNRFVESQPQIQNSRSNRRSTAVFNSSTYFTHRRSSFNVGAGGPRSHIKRTGEKKGTTLFEDIFCPVLPLLLLLFILFLLHIRYKLIKC